MKPTFEAWLSELIRQAIKAGSIVKNTCLQNMFSKTIKTTNGNLIITIPSNRDEITLGMLEALTPAPGHSFSQLEQLSILSGIPTGNKEFDKKEYDIEVDTLCDIKNIDDLKVFDEPLQALAYQLSAFEEIQSIPEGITLDMPHPQRSQRGFSRIFNRDHKGKYIPVIKDLGVQPAGAYMEAKEVIKEEFAMYRKAQDYYVKQINPDLVIDSKEWQAAAAGLEFNPSIESYIKILCLYFYCKATDQKFSPGKAYSLVPVIKKLSITQALPIARYFFLAYPNLSKPKATPSLETWRKLRGEQE